MDVQLLFEQIVSDQSQPQKHKIESLLELGLDFLGLGIALVSKVDKDAYTVLFAKSPGDMIQPGTSFKLGETYCWHTLQKKKVIGVHHAGASEISNHPCYEHFKLEAYVGAPVFQQGKVIGTVNFSAAAPRDPFSDKELAFVEQLATWLEKTLSG